MAITTYDTDYHDDFAEADANGLTPRDKNYLRILFKPGYSVQTRELNQLQSMLQNQIDAASTGLYRQGAAVIGAESTFDADVTYVDFPLTNEPLFFDNVESTDQLTLTGSTGLAAKVVSYELLDSTMVRLYIKYANSSVVSNANVSAFTGGAGATLFNIGTSQSITDNIVAVGSAVSTTLSAGVFYVKGNYVVTPIQRKFITIESGSSYTGFSIIRISEAVVSSNDDATLLDNAANSPNYSALGADRYSIDLELDLIETESAVPDYYKLLTIIDGSVVYDTKDSAGGIDSKLAQRTYEESGDYTLNPFPVSIQEVYNNGSNRGKYPEELLVDKGFTGIAEANSKLLINLDSSVAYVKGYRVALVDRLSLITDRARDTYKGTFSAYKSAAISAAYGNTIDGEITSGSPLCSARNRVYTLYDIYDSAIGSLKIKAVESGQSGNPHRLYVYDIIMNPGSFFQDAVTIRYVPSDATYGQLEFVIGAGQTLRTTNLNTAFFELPYSAISDVNRIQYSERREFSGVISSETITLSVSGSDYFPNPSDNLLIFIENGSSEIVPFDGAYTLSNVTGTSFELTDLTGLDGRKYVVVASVQVESFTPGTKTLKTRTVSLLADTDVALADKHIHKLVSWLPSNANVTLVSDGQSDNAVGAGVVHSDTALTELVYEYFEFSANSSYFTVNSYLDGRSPGAPFPLAYADIPKYDETRLSDVIDFRDYGSSGILPQVDPFNAIELALDYYLSRVDKVHVNASGVFSVTKGFPGEVPKDPPTPDDSMVLYKLTIPAYTFSLNDIDVQYIDNRRYTMRDIGKLEQRISNVEYYAALSLLEKEASETQILDDDGTDRFKNGFITDAFYGHGVGDVFDPSYKCAVDRVDGVCRPFFSMNMVPLQLDSASPVSGNDDFPISGNHKEVITLPYKEIPTAIGQDFASRFISVNPYELSTFVGSLALNPDSDNWIDTLRTPDVLTVDDEGSYDAIKFLAEEQGVLGSEWNAWETHWTGVTNEKLTKKQSKAYRKTVPKGTKKFKRYNQQTITQDQTRSGTLTTLTGKVEQQSLGDRVIDINIRPYIRSRRVWFKASNLRPNTRVWAYFDGVDVSEWCRISDLVTWSSANTGDPVTDLPTLISTSTGSQTLISDDDGTLYGYFNIPSTDLLRFLTGSRVFRVSDSPRNVDEEISTFADSTYHAAGMLQTKQETILSTKVPEFSVQDLSDQRTIVDVNMLKAKRKSCKWFDPIAQTILIHEETGIFATSIDMYFSSKPVGPDGTNAPVSLYIVTTDNGFPTQQIVPFSRVDLNASGILTSEDAAVATRFRFEQPVYLLPDKEYAIVCVSTDPAYKVYIAEKGKVDIKSQNVISGNPYLGVFFTSQNSSTWTPEQSLDLKFRMNRAEFDVSVPRTVTLTKKIASQLDSIRITHGGAGYTTIPTVTVDLPPGGTSNDRALATATITPTGEVGSITITRAGKGYTFAPNIVISNPDTGSDIAEAIGELPEYNACAVNIVQESIILSDWTSIQNSLRLESVTSETAGTNIELSSPYAINRNKRCDVTSVLSSNNPAVSPVLDKQRAGLIVISNLLTNDPDTSSRYITREVGLENPAFQLDVYFGLNRQLTSSSVAVYGEFTYADGAKSSWLPIPIKTPRILPVHPDGDTFSDVNWEITSEQEFVSFRVKVEMLGTNAARVPKIKEFRAIATV